MLRLRFLHVVYRLLLTAVDGWTCWEKLFPVHFHIQHHRDTSLQLYICILLRVKCDLLPRRKQRPFPPLSWMLR